MSEPDISYVTYATQPGADGPQELRAKIFRSPDAEGSQPLLVWFHSGGFRTGDIDSQGHTRISRRFLAEGYACAFVQYRLRAKPKQLRAKTQNLLPKLIADAERTASDINSDFIGAPALAACEDAAAFMAWAETNKDAQKFNGDYILGGSSAGGMTVLNLLHLAQPLGLTVPKARSAVILSGAFVYPSYYTQCETRVLAIQGDRETQMPATSIRGYAYLAGDRCTLIEHRAHQHGDPRITREEPLRRALRRMIEFDRGAGIASERQDRPPTQPKPKRDYRFCIFTCVRNEGPFLLEWIAHNRAIGVTDFVIFSNDCDDGTAELLDALDGLGIVKHVMNPSVALGSDQHLNLAVHCAPYTKEFRKSDYAILTDVDEFIQVNVADGTLNGLLAVMGHPDVISLSELLYGFGGVEKYENRLISSQFRVSRSLTPGKDGARQGVKSIMRVSRMMAAYSNHRPRIKPEAVEAAEWKDGRGEPMSPEFIAGTKRGLDARGRYALARVNHFTLRSAESMLVKFERGDAVRPGRMREKYFRDRNGNDQENVDFLRFIPGIKRELTKLLAEPEILKWHRYAVKQHRSKIKKLKADPDYAEVWQAMLEELAQPRADLPEAAE